MPRVLAKPVEMFREGLRCRLERQLAVGAKTNRDPGRIGAHPSVESIAIDANVIRLIGRAHIEAAVGKFEEAPAATAIHGGKLRHAVVDATLDRKHVSAEERGKRFDSGMLGYDTCLDIHRR